MQDHSIEDHSTPDSTTSAAQQDLSGAEAPAKERPALPDRLSTDPQSPFYDEVILGHDVGVRFKGAEKTNVEEYCVGEGWVRLTVGASKDRRGKPMTVKLKGEVAPYFR